VFQFKKINKYYTEVYVTLCCIMGNLP